MLRTVLFSIILVLVRLILLKSRTDALQELKYGRPRRRPRMTRSAERRNRLMEGCRVMDSVRDD
jgi:hypothetical protein